LTGALEYPLRIVPLRPSHSGSAHSDKPPGLFPSLLPARVFEMSERGTIHGLSEWRYGP